MTGDELNVSGRGGKHKSIVLPKNLNTTNSMEEDVGLQLQRVIEERRRERAAGRRAPNARSPPKSLWSAPGRGGGRPRCGFFQVVREPCMRTELRVGVSVWRLFLSLRCVASVL